MVTLDCADAEASAAVLVGTDGMGRRRLASDGYAMLSGPRPRPRLRHASTDYEPPAWPNEHGSKQFHFDLAVTDLDAAQEAAVELGATVADPQPGETWRVLLDPSGHPFCLTDGRELGLSACGWSEEPSVERASGSA